MFTIATLIDDRRFEVLLAELSSRSSSSKDELLELIRIKKSKVGAGYLTSQGALFLVASDLGVTVDYDHTKPASISHLTPDQKSVTLIARVLAIGIPRVFTRKSDSRKGLITKILLADNTSQTFASVWDSAIAKIIGDGANFRPGDLVRLSDVYTRPGLDGQPVVNFGESSSIEKAADDAPGTAIDSLEKFTSTPSALGNSGKPLVIRGKIKGDARKASFARSDGSAAEYVTFDLSDEDDRSSVRAVIWNNPTPVFENLHDGGIVTLLNVRTRPSTFQNSGTLEIHGDENTCLLESFEETRKWMNGHIQTLTSQGLISANEGTKPKEAVPFIGRVVSKRKSDPTDGRSYLLAIDSLGRKISVLLSGEAVNNVDSVSLDDVALFKPEVVDYSLLKASCTSIRSITRVNSKRPDISLSASLFARVEDLVENSIISLDLICLTDPVSREIQTKEGLVRRSEVLLADHTGEIKLYGWRSLAKILDRCAIGERIEVRAVEVQTYESKKFLVMKNYSSIGKSSTFS